MTADQTDVRIEERIDGEIGWLVFNQPDRRNAISEDMWPSIAAAMERFDANDAVRVIVMRGAGEEAFVSGGDISEFEGRIAGAASVEARARFNQAADEGMEALRCARKPLIAMIHGVCFGGGVAVAQQADMLVASEEAKFCIPAARLGVGYPRPIVQRLSALVGPLAAADLLLTARIVSAAEAKALGLLNAVTPKAELETYTRRLAQRVAANAPLTVRAAKTAIRASSEGATADFEAVDALVAACMRSDDFLEGARAFLEKRTPAFRGR